MCGYTLYHDIDSNPETNEHLAGILESLRANGWVGLPLLAVGDQLLNGCHRATACKILGISPEVHQAEIGATFGDGYDYLLLALAEANSSDAVLQALLGLQAEGLVDDYTVHIMRTECNKE